MLTGCLKNEKVAIHADFTTDKDVYELYEDIHLTNTSYAENAYVISSKWEWDGKKMWGHQPEEPISFDRTGEFEIKLTVTTDVDNVTAVKVKTVKIQDTNTAPVADFTWEPVSGIRAGDSVKFTDKSSDPDGAITAWEWSFGTTVVNEQNPEFTFVEFGDIQVSLTVTDNMKKRLPRLSPSTLTRASIALNCFGQRLTRATRRPASSLHLLQSAQTAVLCMHSPADITWQRSARTGMLYGHSMPQSTILARIATMARRTARPARLQ